MDRILIVDDDNLNCKAIRRLLNEEKLEIFIAASGSEALTLVPQISPDLIILDIVMPGMDGLETCRRIKDTRAEIMVLLLSARGELADRLRGYEALADDYLVKPFEPEELHARIRILLRLKQTRDQLDSLNKSLARLVQERTHELVRQQRQALVGQMIHGIVHNFRSPLLVAEARTVIIKQNLDRFVRRLASISGDQQLILDKIFHNLKTQRQAIERIAEMVERLLSRGKSDARLNAETFSLNELVSQEIAFIRHDERLLQGVDLQLRLDQSLPPIHAHYSDFAQVFANLITNALEAMATSARRRLTITTAHDHHFLKLSCGDSGPGIDSRDMDHIFDPFYSTKEHCSLKTGTSGTGLGLHISRQLMETYSGTITAENLPEAGALFTVHIPRKMVHAPAPSPPDSSTEQD